MTEPGDQETGHAACVVARVAVGARAYVADGVQEPEGIRSGADLAGGGRGVEQLSAHRHEAVEEVGVQGLEAGPVGLQRRSEPVLGDQEVGEEIDPAGQRCARCAAAGQQGWPGFGAGVDLVAVDGDDEVGPGRPEGCAGSAAGRERSQAGEWGGWVRAPRLPCTRMDRLQPTVSSHLSWANFVCSGVRVDAVECVVEVAGWGLHW